MNEITGFIRLKMGAQPLPTTGYESIKEMPSWH